VRGGGINVLYLVDVALSGEKGLAQKEFSKHTSM
jgi:hypothetical protein